MLYICTVFCDATSFRENGRRLKRSELAPPIRATLIFSESDRDSNNSKRNLLTAVLWQNFGTTRLRCAGRIFDPVLLPHASGGGILIAGTELSSTDVGRVIYEHRQVWLCVPVLEAPDGTPINPQP